MRRSQRFTARLPFATVLKLHPVIVVTNGDRNRRPREERETMTTRTLTRIAPVLGAIALLTGALVQNAGASIRRRPRSQTRQTAASATDSTFAPRTRSMLRPAVLADQSGVDLQSPDTRDSAAAAAVTRAPVVVVNESPAFDWTDAGIGAGCGFAVALLLVGMTLLASRGRGGEPRDLTSHRGEQVSSGDDR